MSVLPLLSLQCINKGKSRRRAANRGGTTTTTNARRSIHRRQQVHPIIVCALCPVHCSFLGIAPGVAFGRWFVLILKLRCHFKGIRNGNRMPASGRDRVKKRITWMDVIFSSALLAPRFGICYCFRRLLLLLLDKTPATHGEKNRYYLSSRDSNVIMCGVNWIHWNSSDTRPRRERREHTYICIRTKDPTSTTSHSGWIF